MLWRVIFNCIKMLNEFLITYRIRQIKCRIAACTIFNDG